MELKEPPLVLGEVCEVCGGVRPLQEAPARGDLAHCRLEEGRVGHLEPVVRAEQGGHGPDALQLLHGSKLLRLVVLHVPLIEVCVPEELGLGQRLGVQCALRLRRGVAGLVASPRLHADPAELVAATAWLPARHVHAATILLNGVLALGADLGIHADPGGVAARIAVLVLPVAHGLARDRQVRIRAAAKAPDKAAWTAHLLPADAGLLRSPPAMLPRAPAQSPPGVVHEALCQKTAVAFQCTPLAQERSDVRGPHSLAATWRRAAEVQAGLSIGHGVLEILAPTVAAV
mmetsp:Transcript_99650/g.297691  ORF Transcript_99650/g.297691 Transcript_99650/m.297691 type:complete len:288 (-) Transcript_99650:55-918(-)